MKLDKTNVCVLIESEAQLQEARELLERYNQPIGHHFQFLGELDDSILKFGRVDNKWFVGFLSRPDKTQITLSELEEILKGEKDDTER